MRIVARAQDPPPDPRFRARGAVWLHNILHFLFLLNILHFNKKFNSKCESLRERKIRRLIRAFGRGAQYGSKIFFITDGLWDES